MDYPDLKPCPFCENDNSDVAKPLELQGDGDGEEDEMHWVLCWTCMAAGPTAHSEVGAMQAWNERS